MKHSGEEQECGPRVQIRAVKKHVVYVTFYTLYKDELACLPHSIIERTDHRPQWITIYRIAQAIRHAVRLRRDAAFRDTLVLNPSRRRTVVASDERFVRFAQWPAWVVGMWARVLP
eukprot:4853900-Prymnesium_polylepis.1